MRSDPESVPESESVSDPDPESVPDPDPDPVPDAFYVPLRKRLANVCSVIAPTLSRRDSKRPARSSSRHSLPA
jgi:hypothetical protein